MKYATFICFMLFSFAAFAADAVPVPLTYNQALDLANAIASLDSYDKVIQEPPQKPQDGLSPHERVVKTPYNFSGATRLLIGRDLQLLKAAVEPAQQAVRQIRTQAVAVGKSDEVIKNEIAEVGEKQIEPPLSLWKIKPADMKLDENPIPGTILSALVLILE